MADSQSTQDAAVAATPIPVHQWTHDGDRVLIVKFVNRDGTSYGGHLWPEKGNTICPKVAKNRNEAKSTSCETGGLFGWPWGIGIGDGKDPDYSALWVVFAANPDDVIDCGGKVKAIGEVEVVFSGEWYQAFDVVIAGQISWVKQASRGAATGWSGAASATGARGAASATGARGAASATGESGAASATGWSGAASATGESGAATLTGEYGTIEVSGNGTLGAVTAVRWCWRVRKGAIVACRWLADDGTKPAKLLSADELGLKDGQLAHVILGEIVEVTDV